MNKANITDPNTQSILTFPLVSKILLTVILMNNNHKQYKLNAVKFKYTVKLFTFVSSDSPQTRYPENFKLNSVNQNEKINTT